MGVIHVCTGYVFSFCRETEWLFSSDPGRRQLAESAGFERLVIVTLHRGHAYSSLDAVKEEVAGKAVELIQQGLPHGKQVTGAHLIKKHHTKLMHNHALDLMDSNTVTSHLKELCHHISVFLITEAGWGSPLSNLVRGGFSFVTS